LILFTISFRILMFPDCTLQNCIHNGKTYFILFVVIYEETTVDSNDNSVFRSKISTLITVNYWELSDSFLAMQKMCLAKTIAQSRVLQHYVLNGVNQLNCFAVSPYYIIWCVTFSWLCDVVMELFVWCFFNMWPSR
jgi:hypothetical protein